MPLFNIVTSAPPLPAPALTQFLQRMSGLLASKLGKSERYVMTALDNRTAMTFGGETSPSCYAELKNVGSLTQPEVDDLSRELCDELSSALHVPRDRIYIEFTNSDGALWGWNGGTFA